MTTKSCCHDLTWYRLEYFKEGKYVCVCIHLNTDVAQVFEIFPCGRPRLVSNTFPANNLEGYQEYHEVWWQTIYPEIWSQHQQVNMLIPNKVFPGSCAKCKNIALAAF